MVQYFFGQTIGIKGYNGIKLAAFLSNLKSYRYIEFNPSILLFIFSLLFPHVWNFLLLLGGVFFFLFDPLSFQKSPSSSWLKTLAWTLIFLCLQALLDLPALVTYLALSVSQGGPKGPSVLEQLKLPMPLPASLMPFGVNTRNPISSSSDTSEIGVFLVVFLVKVLEFAGVGERGDIGPLLG